MADKRKKIQHEILDRDNQRDEYALLDTLVGEHHPHLVDAKIGLAWRFGFKEDRDGRIVLGRCKKCGDLEREAHGLDFIISLNYEFWIHPDTTAAHRAALLDHELCHAAVSEDEEGEVREDVKGRPVWRIRKHDVEEFREIVARHGVWKQDLQRFAEAIREAKGQPLLQTLDAKSTKGVTVTLPGAPAQQPNTGGWSRQRVQQP